MRLKIRNFKRWNPWINRRDEYRDIGYEVPCRWVAYGVHNIKTKKQLIRMYRKYGSRVGKLIEIGAINSDGYKYHNNYQSWGTWFSDNPLAWYKDQGQYIKMKWGCNTKLK